MIQPTTMEQVRAEIAAVREEPICSQFNEESEVDDLPVDSLEYIQLLRGLEQIFGILIEEEDLEGVVTLGDLCKVIDRKRAAKVMVSQENRPASDQ